MPIITKIVILLLTTASAKTPCIVNGGLNPKTLLTVIVFLIQSWFMNPRTQKDVTGVNMFIIPMIA
jgi:hypothetical protein